MSHLWHFLVRKMDYGLWNIPATTGPNQIVLLVMALVLMATCMRSWLLSLFVLYAMLCPSELLLLLLWFLLFLFVALMQVVWPGAFSMLMWFCVGLMSLSPALTSWSQMPSSVISKLSVMPCALYEMLWPAVVLLLSVWPPHADLRVELPSLRQVQALLPPVEILGIYWYAWFCQCFLYRRGFRWYSSCHRQRHQFGARRRVFGCRWVFPGICDSDVRRGWLPYGRQRRRVCVSCADSESCVHEVRRFTCYEP